MPVIRQNLWGCESLRERGPLVVSSRSPTVREGTRGRRASRGHRQSPDGEPCPSLGDRNVVGERGRRPPAPAPPLPGLPCTGRERRWAPPTAPCAVGAREGEGGPGPSPGTVLRRPAQRGSGSSRDEKSGCGHQQCRVPQTLLSSPALKPLKQAHGQAPALRRGKPCCA